MVHDLATNDPERSIVAIENGHVTGRKVGDGPSHVVLEALRGNPEQLHDHLSYLTRTKDGKILKSTTIYIRDDDGAPIGIFGINYDITLMLAMENAIKQFKDDTQVRDITLRELSKYGKSHQFGDCRLEEAESGVKYDYSMCGDSKLRDMYETLEALKVDIKEREMMLRSMPASGLADPETGEVLFPPARSSKTIIKTTFKKPLQ